MRDARLSDAWPELARIAGCGAWLVTCAQPPPAEAPASWTAVPAEAPASSKSPAAAAEGPAATPPGDEAGLYSTYEGRPALEVLEGQAVYYGDSLAGNHTANGELYAPRRFTAAHKTLPFNTVVRVVRLDTKRHVYVRITDRGPFGNARRIIDLSRIAAERLDMIRRGVIDVRLEVVQWGR